MNKIVPASLISFFILFIAEVFKIHHFYFLMKSTKIFYPILYILSELVLLFLLLLFTIRYCRNFIHPEKRTFDTLFKMGLLYSFILSFLLAINIFVYLSYLQPDEMNTFKIHFIEFNQSTSEDATDQESTNINKSVSPFTLAINELAFIFYGGIFSLIIAAIYRKKEIPDS